MIVNMLSGMQQKIVDYFKKAASEGSLRQAYILSGDSGIGKKTIVPFISEALMCETHSMCLKCNGCLSVISGTNPDVITVSNGDKKTIEIEKIRRMIKNVYVKPSNGKYRLFVIENAHLMDASPQNALLKVIEEPPEYAVFILICDKINTLLPTILSRSIVFKITPTPVCELKQMYSLPKEKGFLYSYCMGNIGALISASEREDFMALRSGVTDTFIKMCAGDETDMYDAIDFWVENDKNKQELSNVLTMLLRDIMLIKNGLAQNIVNKDKFDKIEAASKHLTSKQAFDMLCIADSMPAKVGKYGNFGMAVQTMFMQLREEING